MLMTYRGKGLRGAFGHLEPGREYDVLVVNPDSRLECLQLLAAEPDNPQAVVARRYERCGRAILNDWGVNLQMQREWGLDKPQRALGGDA